jgi:hypothetical protein
MSTLAFAEFSAARRSRDPAIRFTRALNFEASVVRTLLQGAVADVVEIRMTLPPEFSGYRVMQQRQAFADPS